MKKTLTQEEVVLVVQALTTVSFYARISHDKAKDYGEIVDPVLKKIGVTPGQMYSPKGA